MLWLALGKTFLPLKTSHIFLFVTLHIRSHANGEKMNLHKDGSCAACCYRPVICPSEVLSIWRCVRFTHLAICISLFLPILLYIIIIIIKEVLSPVTSLLRYGKKSATHPQMQNMNLDEIYGWDLLQVSKIHSKPQNPVLKPERWFLWGFHPKLFSI